MSAVYYHHREAFDYVAAYVVAKNSERVATIAFNYPRAKAGRLYAYVQWIGYEMVRGWATGYGYDKHTAACVHASRILLNQISTVLEEGAKFAALGSDADKFINVLGTDDGQNWDYRLRNAGFEVWQAV